MEERDDVFAASSTAQMSRAIGSVSMKEPGHSTFIADCVKACDQAEQTEEVCVEAPIEYRRAREALGPRSGHRLALEEDVARAARRRRWLGAGGDQASAL